jgi:hypothetical protein
MVASRQVCCCCQVVRNLATEHAAQHYSSFLLFCLALSGRPLNNPFLLVQSGMARLDNRAAHMPGHHDIISYSLYTLSQFCPSQPGG